MMNLEELLTIISEETIVNIVDYNRNEVISRYDGKNSIDAKLNRREAIIQYVENNELYIVIL